MDEISALTSQLKDILQDFVDPKDKEQIIFKHIKAAEKINYSVEDFPSDLDWFNTSEPLHNVQLKGKVVVLDFFTYCCINCLHVIPHLRQLEENFSVADGLVVVGVHSAKFDNEKDSKNILQALKRYNITHPVVNDKNCYMWNKLGISCWPTIVILGPERQPLFVLIGEGHRDELSLFIKSALNFYKKSLSSHRLPIVARDHIVTSSLLNFPGKIARWNNLYAISDSGNHRIIIIDENGCTKFKVGGKTSGFRDGTFETAQFNSPQGVAFYDSKKLYVADTENHAIRLVTLDPPEVTTVVGNGRQGTDHEGGKLGTLQEISSPWDVCVVPCSDVDVQHLSALPLPVSRAMAGGPPPPPFPPPPHLLSPPIPPPMLAPSGDVPLLPPPPPPPANTSVSNTKKDERKVLLIAAAGTHQIWAYFIEGGVWWKGKNYEKNVCVAVAGSGKEENRNSRYPMAAGFAQPSGLTYSHQLKSVFVADSESSSVRKLSLKDGCVSHVAGGAKSPNDLFSYGDVDGRGHDAKLQHPLGVAWSTRDNLLYVCDTYNHKIKRVNVDSGECKSLKRVSEPFSEPGGACLNESEDSLYVCDTNNNCVKVYNLAKGTVEKLKIEEKQTTAGDTSLKDLWTIDAELSKNGGTLTLEVVFFPKEVHGKWSLETVDESKMSGKISSNVVEIVLKMNPSDIDDVLLIRFDLVLCGNETCSFKKVALRVQLKRTEKGEKTVKCELRKTLV